MIRNSNSLHPAPFSPIEDILKCVICFEKSTDARMCPLCSILFCKTCIRKWLSENRSQCPHCRGALRFEQLVSCRLISEISEALENFSSVKKDIIENCPFHECPLNYYCSTCSLAVCSDCAMFSAEHKSHEFKHLTSVYTQHLNQINTESKVLNQRIQDLDFILKNLENNTNKLKLAKAEKSQELSLSLSHMLSRLEDQLNKKTADLIAKKKLVESEIYNLKVIQSETDRDLAQLGKNKLIIKTSDLIKKLQDSQGNPISVLDFQESSCEFSSEVVPKYESGVFELSDLTQAPEVVYSEVLEYTGLLWRLKVYPNGNGVAKGSYLSVFLELLKGYGESAKYEYRVELLNHLDPGQMIVREFASDFETGECWGYNRFFKISLLKEEGFLTENNSLKMKFYVRAPNYYQLYKDQANYIKTLQEKQEKYKGKIDEFLENTEKNTPVIGEEILANIIDTAPKLTFTDSSDSELTPLQIDWQADMPDFHCYSDFNGQDPDSSSQELWPLGENLIQAIESIQASLK